MSFERAIYYRVNDGYTEVVTGGDAEMAHLAHVIDTASVDPYIELSARGRYTAFTVGRSRFEAYSIGVLCLDSSASSKAWAELGSCLAFAQGAVYRLSRKVRLPHQAERPYGAWVGVVRLPPLEGAAPRAAWAADAELGKIERDLLWVAAARWSPR